MAFTSSCCLNIPGPTPASNPSSPKTPPVAWKKNEDGKWWRKRCVLGMACMIVVGPEMSNFVIEESHNNIAIAQEYYMPSNTKWSDKRSCPPWRLNSLETIVPENLPRPSARRRWEWVDYYSKNAPAVKLLAVTTTTDCFSL